MNIWTPRSYMFLCLTKVLWMQTGSMSMDCAMPSFTRVCSKSPSSPANPGSSLQIKRRHILQRNTSRCVLHWSVHRNESECTLLAQQLNKTPTEQQESRRLPAKHKQTALVTLKPDWDPTNSPEPCRIRRVAQQKPYNGQEECYQAQIGHTVLPQADHLQATSPHPAMKSLRKCQKERRVRWLHTL